jgi:hypothetical protein
MEAVDRREDDERELQRAVQRDIRNRGKTYARCGRGKEVFELLVLYGLMSIFLTAFFVTFVLISTGYLIGFLVKRRQLRTRPAVKVLEPEYA